VERTCVVTHVWPATSRYLHGAETTRTRWYSRRQAICIVVAGVHGLGSRNLLNAGELARYSTHARTRERRSGSCMRPPGRMHAGRHVAQRPKHLFPFGHVSHACSHMHMHTRRHPGARLCCSSTCAYVRLVFVLSNFSKISCTTIWITCTITHSARKIPRYYIRNKQLALYVGIYFLNA
jgi:hypothetical protein